MEEFWEDSDFTSDDEDGSGSEGKSEDNASSNDLEQFLPKSFTLEVYFGNKPVKQNTVCENGDADESKVEEEKLPENNRQRVIAILRNSSNFCDKLGIPQEFKSENIRVKSEGCMDGAVYDDGNKKIFFKLSSATSVNENGECEVEEYKTDLLVDYILFSALKKLGCNVPKVYICKHSIDGYLFASEGIVETKVRCEALGSFLLRDDTTKKEVGIKDLDLLKTLLPLYIVGAQDLNSENLMVDSDGRICCIDANFEAFYRRNVEEDKLAKQYNSVKIPLSDKRLSDIASKLGLQFEDKSFWLGSKFGRSKINRLLVAVTYFNQLSQYFDDFNKKGKLAFHRKLSKIILDDEWKRDFRLDGLAGDVNELFESKDFENGLFNNSCNLGSVDEECAEQTICKVKKFALRKLCFLKNGHENLVVKSGLSENAVVSHSEVVWFSQKKLSSFCRAGVAEQPIPVLVQGIASV